MSLERRTVLKVLAASAASLESLEAAANLCSSTGAGSELVGYQFTFLFFAICGGVLAFIPILGLMWKGREWRERLGKPQNVNAFDSKLRGDVLDADGIEVKA